MDGSRAYSAMKVAGVSHRLLFLRSHVNSRAMRAGEMNDQPEIVAHAPMMPDSAIFLIAEIRHLAHRCLSLPKAKSAFEPCIPTRGTKMPDRPEWIHEVKHDDYRLIALRADKRVQLFTRNGHDWTERYSSIVEATLRNRNSSFVINGEAVLLGVDGISDFNGLHSRKLRLRRKSSSTPARDGSS